MIKNLSLRVKITAITTAIMILISVILTIVSVFNANKSIYSLDTAMDQKWNSYNNSAENQIENNSNNKDESINPSENTAVDNAKYLFKVNAIIYMVIIIVIGSIFIYFVLGKVLRPIKELSEEVEVINEHKLSQRVSEFNSKDEVGELAHSFNTMLDRLDKAFESQKRFSTDAAHELKTPLTVLKTNLDVLEMDEKPSDEEYKHIINIFKKQTERMINLVNNLFILSEQKGYDFNDKIEFDVMIEEILNDLDNEIKNKHLSIYFNKSNVSTVGNNIMLKHAVSNIVQNAVKYNNDYGDVFIYVKKNEKDCVIEIKDTGIGISKEKAENIFDAFYRVDKSRSRKVGGAGLGLAITKDIINSHHGKITYLPNKECGSIFEITIPLHQ